jgi:hypothetical protein
MSYFEYKKTSGILLIKNVLYESEDIPSTLNYKPTWVGSNSSETPGPSHSKAQPPGWAYNRVSTVDQLSLIVIKNQQTIYQPELVESFNIFQHILTISPELCWVVQQINNNYCGHLIAHPWPDIDYPPRLNRDSDILKLSNKPQIDNTGYYNIFIHDLTIIPEMKNMGVGRELVSKFLAYLYSLKQNINVLLVSVCGSIKFWEKQGFKPISKELNDRQLDILKSYGDKTATIMRLNITLLSSKSLLRL